VAQAECWKVKHIKNTETTYPLNYYRETKNGEKSKEFVVPTDFTYELKKTKDNKTRLL